MQTGDFDEIEFFRRLTARLRDESERAVTAEEARAYLATPISDDERDEILTLVHWFRRRYPTPADRLAYIRRAHARWQRLQRPIGPSAT
jgi:hypothetical protein